MYNSDIGILSKESVMLTDGLIIESKTGDNLVGEHVHWVKLNWSHLLVINGCIKKVRGRARLLTVEVVEIPSCSYDVMQLI